MYRTILLYGLAVAVLWASACGQDESEVVGAPVAERDSSGIHIVETQGRSGRAPLSWAVNEFPSFTIGCTDGPAEYLFDNITGLVRRPDGGVLVIDRGSSELRFFDSQGRLTHSAGGDGRGPGEFLLPELIHTLSSDSIFVYDRRLRRLTKFGHDGRVIMTQPTQSLRGTAIGAVGRHLVAYRTVVMFPSEPGLATKPAEFWIYDPASSTNTQLGTVRGQQTFSFRYSVRSAVAPEGIMAGYAVPFDIMPSATVGRELVYITPGEGPEIRAYDVTGQLRRILRLDEPTRMVTDSELRRYVDERVAQSSLAAEERAGYAGAPRPTIMPAFRSLIMDLDGWLWAGVYDPGDGVLPRSWVVFDTAGVAQGTVRTPDGLEIHEIGPDFVLGVISDQLGVERVALFDLVRDNHLPRSDEPSEDGPARAGSDATACISGFDPA